MTANTYIPEKRNNPENKVDPKPIYVGQTCHVTQSILQTTYVRLKKRSASDVDADQRDH